MMTISCNVPSEDRRLRVDPVLRVLRVECVDPSELSEWELLL